MKISYEALLPFYHWIWKHWREKRWNKFRELIEPCPEDRVLDVGGCSGDWIGRGNMINCVDVLNLEKENIPEHPNSPKMVGLAGDGCSLEVSDQSYDIVFSNSVIEHVGGWDDQLKFATEARRVGKKLWIQTPAYGCPVEPHYLGLFVHWFPQAWHVPIARWTSVVGLTGAADLESIASTTRLLTKKEYRTLFPDCEIWTERLFLIFPKSYIALRAKADES